jgi:hypothetical protein
MGNGLSWDLVFRALPGATGGGLTVPTTQWDGANRQEPPGKPQRRRTAAHYITFSRFRVSCCAGLQHVLIKKRERTAGFAAQGNGRWGECSR